MCTSQWEGGGGGGGGWGLFAAICQYGRRQTSFFAVIQLLLLPSFEVKEKKNIRLARCTVIPSVVLLNLVVRVSVINGSRLF